MLHAMGMLKAVTSLRPCCLLLPKPKELRMQFAKLSMTTLLVGAGLVACGDNSGNTGPDAAPATFETNSCTKLAVANCMQIKSGDSATLQTMANTIGADTTLVLD